MKRSILYIASIFCATNLWGQEHRVRRDTADLSDYTIEELTRMKSRYTATEMEKTINQAITASSRKPLPLRRSPSIISVVTGDDIEKSGAQDLMDVLALIPGVEFNVDVEGVVALSFRGLWANEGSISLQIDGIEVNEVGYASLQFGNHYALSQIKKIEIIRGPGSAIYGGCAEYAVINIITRNGDDLKGIRADVLAGEAKGAFARRNGGLSIGNRKGDWTYSASGMIARGQRSNRQYSDAKGNTFGMAGNSDLNNDYVNLAASYKGLSARFVYDNYQTTNRDGDYTILSKAYPVDFRSYLSEVKYMHRLGKKTELAVKLNHKYSEPWSYTGQPEPQDSTYTYYLLQASTLRGNVSLMWDVHRWLNVLCGLESHNDRGRLEGGQVFRTDSTNEVSYMNYAPYAQLLLRSAIANVTVGARYDVSTAFGSAFNPRLGITRRMGAFNFKLLYASSFRAPAIESIQRGIDNMKLKPEQSNTLELEASMKIRKDMYLSVNVFDISTKNAIRYFVKTDSVTVGEPDGYRNSDQLIGSRGVEVEYKYRSRFGYVNVAWSYYTVAGKSVDESNVVPVNDAMTLGTARSKLAVSGSVNLTDRFFISPSLVTLGKRWSYETVDANDNGILYQWQPQLVMNLYAGCKEPVPNLSGGIGISNITDERIVYPQAYNSYHAALPGMGRTVYLKIMYTIPFK